jgi:hypothetical protein
MHNQPLKSDKYLNHRHLRYVHSLMACTACLAYLVSTLSGFCKNTPKSRRSGGAQNKQAGANFTKLFCP